MSWKCTEDKHYEECLINVVRRIGYTVVCPIFIFLGIFGCIMNLMVMTGPRFRSKTYLYLRALSVSDLIFLCWCVSFFYSVFSEAKSAGFLTYQAQYEKALVNGFVGTSIFIIVAVTLDRYYRICRPGNLPRDNQSGVYICISRYYRICRPGNLPRDNQSGVYIFIAVFGGFAIQVPRVFQETIATECVRVGLMNQTWRTGRFHGALCNCQGTSGHSNYFSGLFCMKTTLSFKYHCVLLNF
ncbi:uncharacterized protein LOC111708770 [Eurytemora carolleeae]|uniref:uncharacterized protein LOC111708770 n=1 Tax=Eurytemora carolleeae TaxID=1294199 RepID=UPI000C755D0C|nr:uncharacterized protein LOC111708770 [Eurytemora carolleeae]|eukprot:XP_023338006.1 uncharacterized protein LOC111708770 [Eurytemora affinis]